LGFTNPELEIFGTQNLHAGARRSRRFTAGRIWHLRNPPSSEEVLAIRVVAKVVFASVTPIHHVINGTGILYSELARDSGGVAAPVNTTLPLTDPFMTPS
jgi:hypothetical protein